MNDANTSTQTFTYDALNELTGASDTQNGSYGSLGYTYLANGNRDTETRDGTTSTYTYVSNTNRLYNAGSLYWLYDSTGNANWSMYGYVMGYDGYGRLTSANSGASTYSYNGLDQRISKTAGGVSTNFHYGLTGELLTENAGSGMKDYIYLNGMPLARVDGGSNIYYYHTDQLGNPQQMTDSTGATVWAAYTEPFGSATITTSTIANNLRLPGMYADSETGLYYWNSRYYDPRIGRSITPDRLGVAEHVALWQARLGTLNQVPLELNPYVYVANNPLRWIDPSGLAACNGTWELLDEIIAPGSFSTFVCKCRYVCKTCAGNYTGITTDVLGFPSSPDEGGANAEPGERRKGRGGTKILPGDPTHCECKEPGGATGCKTCSAYDTGPAPKIGGNR